VLGTSFRDIAAALVTSEEDFRDPHVIVMLVIAALHRLILLLPAKLAWGERPAMASALTY
jgi:hypothetical protein